jgi:hypothetical protein
MATRASRGDAGLAIAERTVRVEDGESGSRKPVNRK